MQKLHIFILIADQSERKCSLFSEMDFEMTHFIFAYFHGGGNFQRAALCVWSLRKDGHIKCFSVWLYSC